MSIQVSSQPCCLQNTPNIVLYRTNFFYIPIHSTLREFLRSCLVLHLPLSHFASFINPSRITLPTTNSFLSAPVTGIWNLASIFTVFGIFQLTRRFPTGIGILAFPRVFRRFWSRKRRKGTRSKKGGEATDFFHVNPIFPAATFSWRRPPHYILSHHKTHRSFHPTTYSAPVISSQYWLPRSTYDIYLIF